MFVHSSDSNSACSITVSIAFFSLSGGYPCFLSTRRIAFLIPALTLSLTVQSMVNGGMAVTDAVSVAGLMVEED